MKNGEQIDPIDELKDIMKYDLFPLIQEYCFDDYLDKIALRLIQS